jgi:hypothetical protein
MSDQHTQASQNQQYRAEWLPGFGISADNALCDTDATNVFHLSGSWQLPVGRGRTLLSNSNRAVDTLLGGWAVNFIYGYQGGSHLRSIARLQPRQDSAALPRCFRVRISMPACTITKNG